MPNMGAPISVEIEGELEDSGRRPEHEAAAQIESGSSGKTEESRSHRWAAYGLCSRCAHFSYLVTTADGDAQTRAECDAWKSSPIAPGLRLTTQRRVKDCSFFQPKHEMPLAVMFKIATVLDVTSKGPDKPGWALEKRPVGNYR